MTNGKSKLGEPLGNDFYEFWNPHHKTNGKYDGQPKDCLRGTVEHIREVKKTYGRDEKRQWYVDFVNASATYKLKTLKETVFTWVASDGLSRIIEKMQEGSAYQVVYIGPKDVGQPNPFGEFEVRPVL